MTALTGLTFNHAIDAYIADQRSAGRINSPGTETRYRYVLGVHSDDVGNADPATVDRNGVKRTLTRWPNPNSQAPSRSVLVSFYTWMLEEGMRTDNPASQTRRPRPRPTSVYRLTRAEVVALLGAADTTRERRVVYLGLLAGLRNAELRGLRGAHFQRGGFVWVSADIAKGGRERWVPVLPELEPIAADIAARVDAGHYVIPSRRKGNPAVSSGGTELPGVPVNSTTIGRLVAEVAARAGIPVRVHPHLLRHAYGDHIARQAGLRSAQALLGHANVATTQQVYVGQVPLDELAASVRGFKYGIPPAGQPDDVEEEA